MKLHRLFAPLLIIAALSSGCQGASPTTVAAPTMTNVPTAAPTSTSVPTALPAAATALPATTATIAASATAAPTGTPVAIATTTADDLVPAGQINDAAQARVRLAHLVEGGANVDLYLNGALATNARLPLANLPPGTITGYIYLPPGKYHVAVAAAGQSLDKPPFDPVDVSLAAGHRYTLALMGQANGLDRNVLTIDETALALKAGAVPTDSVRIVASNIGESDGVGLDAGGRSDPLNVPYGQALAAVYPAGNFTYHFSLLNNGGVWPDLDGYWNEPASTTLIGYTGANPDERNFHTAAPSSDLGTIPFLQSFSGLKLSMQEGVSFDTLLAAIQTAGLADTLNKPGPYIFFAPTDDAFAALPADKRAALLADPKALAGLLRSLIVPGYYPVGTLAKIGTTPYTRTLTSLQGTPLVVGPDFSLNGADTGSAPTHNLANGVQLHPIITLLMAGINP